VQSGGGCTVAIQSNFLSRDASWEDGSIGAIFGKCIVSLLRGQPTAGSDRVGEPQGITVLNKGFPDPMFGTAPYLLNFSIGPARVRNFHPLGTTGLSGEVMTEKATTTRPGTVQRIIKPPYSGQPEKAEIAVQGADDLYKEIRIENALIDKNGDEVSLKKGAHVEVKIEADPKETVPKQ